MVTNKALAELQRWASAAMEGRGDEAKQHLVHFSHIGAGLIASSEFQARCEGLHDRQFATNDLACLCQLLDAVANIEVAQVEVYGAATR